MKLLTLFVFVAVLKADCPTPPSTGDAGKYSWQHNSFIPVGFGWPDAGPPPSAYTNLSIDSLGFGSSIAEAFSKWSTANAGPNSSNVNFSYNTGGTPFRVYALKINNPGQPGNGDPHTPMLTTIGTISGSNVVGIADTTIYIDTRGLSGGIQMTPTVVEYLDFIQKAMLHEIGHTMGLTDQPTRIGSCRGQIPGESVMNAFCGTNDTPTHLLAPNVTSCDNATVN